MERTDIHRPSVLVPTDYEEVGIWTMNIQGFGDAQFMIQERERCRAHMAKTGGQLHHHSNGSCDICGNVLAIFLVLFYHAKSNEYIVVGDICASKLSIAFDSRGMSIFKKNLANAREAQAGKRKAIALLSDAGIIDAWEIYLTPYPSHVEGCTGQWRDDCRACCEGFNACEEHACNCGYDVRLAAHDQYPERMIREITGQVVRLGRITPKQVSFVESLLRQIVERPMRLAKWQAEKDAAGPVPTGKRITMRGEVIKEKEVEDKFAYSRYSGPAIRTKLIIKLENGSCVYGSRWNNYSKGDKVFFTATVVASDKDPKFGFYTRPVDALTAEELAAKVADKKAAAKQAREDAKFIKTVAWA